MASTGEAAAQGRGHPTADRDAPSPQPQTPTLRRRLTAMIYEGVVLFGVLMVAGIVYGIATNQRNGMQGRHGLQAFIVAVLAVYFCWFWTHGGQTVAMKAWRIRVVSRDGQPVGLGRALLRYAASWLWCLPALAVAYVTGIGESWLVSVAIVTGFIAYAALCFARPDRQFLHDVIAGTRLVLVPASAP